MMTASRVAISLRTLASLAERTADQSEKIIALAHRYAATLRGGGTLFFAGNGGSAADAQHLATEYIVRYSGQEDRGPLAAIALTTDSSLLTAAGNDLGFEQIFARQVTGLCRPGDLLVLHSTSGNSPNLLAAARAARAGGITVLAFLGAGGGALRDLVDDAFVVDSGETSHIQEIHLALEHIIVGLVEQELARSAG
jgi:D-sedoheptulose 7-phosphate isomerase